MASAHSASTTLKFISVQKASVNFGKTAFGQQDTDVNAAGKTIGFDMLYITAVSATTGKVNITGNLNGGFLYGTGTINLKTSAIQQPQGDRRHRRVRKGHRERSRLRTSPRPRPQSR